MCSLWRQASACLTARKISRAIDHALGEAARKQTRIEQREELPSSLHQIEIEGHEPETARRVVVDDQPVTAGHLLRTAHRPPGDGPRSQVVQRPQNQPFVIDLRDRSQRAEPYFQSAEPQHGHVDPHRFLADPGNGQRSRGGYQHDRQPGPPHPRPERKHLRDHVHSLSFSSVWLSHQSPLLTRGWSANSTEPGSGYSSSTTIWPFASFCRPSCDG